MFTGISRSRVRVAALIFLVVFIAAALMSTVNAATTYTFYGCFSEWGIGEEDLTWGTAFLEDETPIRFALNATHMQIWEGGVGYNYTTPTLFNATDAAVSFSFDLGYNTSRIYYTINGAAEDVYCIIPFSSELWNTYTFSIVDFVGLDWGYLELQLPINGTETVIERWDLTSMSDLPITMVWGKTYDLELVTNRGTYTLPTFTAGATQTATISITPTMFYSVPSDISNLTMTAIRNDVTNKISFTYSNAYTDSDYFKISLYESNNATAEWSAQYDDTDTVSTYYPYPEPKDYLAVLECNSTELGIVKRTFSLPYYEQSEDAAYDNHPFAFLRQLGDFPFDVAQLPAVALLLVIAGAISWYHLEWGIILEILATILVVYFGFLLISWAWVGIVAAIGGLLVFSERKTRETG